MDALISILVAVAWIGLTYLTSKIKSAKSTPAASAKPEVPVEMPEMEFSAADSEEHESENPYANPMAEETPYFSYESIPADGNAEATTWRSRPSAQSAPAAEEVQSPALVEGEPFDLRKAFIYQTILHNDFITDWK